jgi:hypothetical protein
MVPLHVCAAEPRQDAAEFVADTATTEVVAESTIEPLHSAADPASFGAALTETCCLCVRS